MRLIILSILVFSALARPGKYNRYYNHYHAGQHGPFQAVESHDGNTAFAYNDGLSTRNEHIHADGTVEGSYKTVDANGHLRTVHYRDDGSGFHAQGDIGVDKVTAEAAAKLVEQAAALANEAPTAPPTKAPEPPKEALAAKNSYPSVQSASSLRSFSYENELSARNEEILGDGTVIGSYKTVDGDGEVRIVHYRADTTGFHVSDDIGDDKATAEAAAKLEEQAVSLKNEAPSDPPTKAPEPPTKAPEPPKEAAAAKNIFQSVQSASGLRSFSYDTGVSARNEKILPDGTVVGSYKTVDGNGDVRIVHYRADTTGFHVDDDIGDDKATAQAGAKLEEQAVALKNEAPSDPPTKAPEPPSKAPEPPKEAAAAKKIYHSVQSASGLRSFSYDTGLSARNEKILHDGTVVGSYKTVDGNGDVRIVRYRADTTGFHVDDDIGDDKATAQAGAKLEEQAVALKNDAPADPPTEAPELPKEPVVADSSRDGSHQATYRYSNFYGRNDEHGHQHGHYHGHYHGLFQTRGSHFGHKVFAYGGL